MSGIYLIWLIIALVTTWAGFKTKDDVHRIALISMGLFFFLLFLTITPESIQLFFKLIFLILLVLWRFILRSSLRLQPQSVQQEPWNRN
ncbi:MAG: hypothetical protein WAN66_29200 [Limnoraphis robusta]|uniref:Uncharacterized protein n=2 Tax=Limnoraphis robusta TaxID=1118279 RepID=A0A0F5YJV8_9CYAN|nr:hypothetical protein [Limnoraphis robusta]KKD38947.1 hypothetical protein WN50_06090 [Limnoraphis robusta CS-951]MEA5498720.1 hypothetical protein [Limnoraphis robusta BA-68 BA1]MEA5518374.1 hypothetical protein [Limnoraphis robusta CCNP1315]MEA5542917.1 hypothetical protein [Limnoraphis robusta Tam1]MEA5547755.1 hypothetical protein [Limnoraphis robusta CCNP1324]